MNIWLGCRVRGLGGVRHSVGSLLALAAAAVLAGARSFAATGEWIADVPQQVLAVVGARFDTGQGRYLAPEESTVRRLTQQVDGDLLDAAISHTTGEDRTDGIVLGQRQAEQKTSEIAWFAPMLDQIDLTHTAVTADALHTTRDHARYLVERGGHYVSTPATHPASWPPCATSPSAPCVTTAGTTSPKGLRYMRRNPTRPLTVLGIPT